jgi:hypothetical protein
VATCSERRSIPEMTVTPGFTSNSSLVADGNASAVNWVGTFHSINENSTS